MAVIPGSRAFELFRLAAVGANLLGKEKRHRTQDLFGLAAPAKTPKETVAQLIDWFGSAVAVPEVRAKLVTMALYPKPLCGADFGAYMQRQQDLFTRLIRELNFKTE